MIRHYLVTALRNLLRNKFYSVIAILGLSFGLASVFLIIQYLRVELAYDRFHKGAENIYRISWENENPQTRTPHPMAQAMVQDFSEVESAVSLSPIWGPGLTRQTFSIRNPERDDRYDETGVLAVDTTFFEVFSFELLKGNPKTVLKNPGGILISESTAKKYFGSVDVVGRQLEVNSEKNHAEVTGVFRDVPKTSHFHFDILASYVREKTLDPGNEYYTWKDFGHFNYVRLKPGTDAKELEAKLLPWARKYITLGDDEFRSLQERHFGFRLQPITDIHLRSHIRWELEPNGNISYVYLMATAALLILVIGSVNFVNLSTAQASERAKEIGIRKSLGAFRRQLTVQFLGEAFLVTGIAVAISIVFIELAMPLFNNLSGNILSVDYRSFLVVLILLGVLVAVAAGIYPSLYLSAARPAMILKDKLMEVKSGRTRQVFIVFQFLASMGLISAGLIISQQLNFLQNKDLGFNAEEVIVLPIKDRSINPRIEELRTELLTVIGVKGVSATSNIPGRSFNQNPIFSSQDPQHRIDVSEAMVDPDFFQVMSIDIVDGRSFLKGNPADADGFILNEEAVKELGLANPVGKEIQWERDGTTLKGPVVGVMKDFHFQSLHDPLRPLLMRMAPRYNYAVLKIETSDLDGTLQGIRKAWGKFDDRFEFEFAFLSEQLTRQYETEKNVATTLGIFSTIGLMIACMGLLGIAALSFRQRTKEVSIRKVMGASLPALVTLLLKDFTRLVIIAIVLAIPLVWWVMNGWLENFSYRVTINPLIFVVTGLALVVLAWVTLGYLVVRLTKISPAETLKAE